MRVYVAGKFQEKDAVREAQAQLKAFGHTITHDWTAEDDARASEPGYLARCAQEDLRGVQTCDAILLLHHPELKGGLVELGVALGYGDCLAAVVGVPRELLESSTPGLCIFYRLARVKHFDTVEEAVSWLTVQAVRRVA